MSKGVHVKVTLKECRGQVDRMIRRFIKKCKKEKVLDTYRRRTDHYIKPSVKKKLKSQRARQQQQKFDRNRASKMFR